MLYTRKGDTGTTQLLDCQKEKRLSKSGFVFEVLGTLDELNSALGYAKVLSAKSKNMLVMGTEKVCYQKILETFQQNLFCIQAELAGSKVSLTGDHTLYLEDIIYEVETILPPIKSFIIPGGDETGAYLDVVRTITRRAERGLVLLRDKKGRVISETSIAYLNRLGSVLYALARLANYKKGYFEKKPE